MTDGALRDPGASNQKAWLNRPSFVELPFPRVLPEDSILWTPLIGFFVFWVSAGSGQWLERRREDTSSMPEGLWKRVGLGVY